MKEHYPSAGTSALPHIAEYSLSFCKKKYISFEKIFPFKRKLNYALFIQNYLCNFKQNNNNNNKSDFCLRNLLFMKHRIEKAAEYKLS